MIDCNILRVTALARSVCGISSLFVLSILPAVTLAQGTESSITMSFVWVEVLSALILLFSGIAIWIIARNQTKKIRELKREAEKLRDADYGEPLRVQPGELGELAAVFNDMRDKLKATTISRDYVDSILASMNDAIVVTANDGTIKRVNKATAHLLGYEEQELVGTTIDFIVNTHKSGTLVDKQPSGVPREAFFESKFGESIPVSYTCSFLGGKEAESGDRIYAAQNITERRRAEKRIRYLARIDALTKIPNRMQFQHLLQRCIARARRSAKPLCLFYIDIDAFKEINDTFGHLAGDTTLETVAERLSAALPDNTIIGRLAGDEFAVILDGFGPDESGRKQTDALAMQLVGRLADPFFVQGHEVFMTASMGIAYYPKDAPNVIDLIRNADAALYHAKKSGGNVYSYYEPAMNEAAVERLMTKSKLKRSFERDELLVHYQPKYNLETRGAGPLGVAREGHDIAVGLHSDRGGNEPHHRNRRMGARQGMRRLSFLAAIRFLARPYEVSPTSLELEITETTLMENPERTIKLLDQLYALGLHLAIDDFGTGYSSLSALQQFPISTLKIDQSFVRHVSTNPDDATIVSTIIQMGRPTCKACFSEIP
jgi:diguanylate cyclase (GGDEF)-like protein/PAS domain S-box-containing protein